MKSTKWMELLSKLPPEYIEEAAEPYEKPRPVLRWYRGAVAAAACLLVAGSAAFLYPRLRMQEPQSVTPQDSLPQTETTTAYTDAEQTELSACLTTADLTSSQETQPTAGATGTVLTESAESSRLSSPSQTRPPRGGTVHTTTAPYYDDSTPAQTAQTTSTTHVTALTTVPPAQTTTTTTKKDDALGGAVSYQFQPYFKSVKCYAFSAPAAVAEDPEESKESFVISSAEECPEDLREDVLADFDFEKRDCLVATLPNIPQTAQISRVKAHLSGGRLYLEADIFTTEPTTNMTRRRLLLAMPKFLGEMIEDVKSEINYLPTDGADELHALNPHVAVIVDEGDSLAS